MAVDEPTVRLHPIHALPATRNSAILTSRRDQVIGRCVTQRVNLVQDALAELREVSAVYFV